MSSCHDGYRRRRRHTAAKGLTVAPPVGERELRLDLFRGLAPWLIFIDHLPANVLTLFTLRNYGFSDATEIFIFISGYTAAFVYGRAMQDRGFVVASARIIKRAWQIYVAHIFLFTIYLAEISWIATRFNPLYAEEMNILDFLKSPDVTIIQALLLRFRPTNMDVLPLYIVLMVSFPPVLWLLRRKADLALGAVGGALCGDVGVRAGAAVLSERPAFFNPYAWQSTCSCSCVVRSAARHAWRASSTRRSPSGSRSFTFAVCLRRDADRHFPKYDFLVPAAVQRWMYPISKTDLDVLSLLTSCAGGSRLFISSPRAGWAEIGLAVADDPVRPAFAGNLLLQHLPGICRFVRHHGVGGSAWIHFVISVAGIVLMRRRMAVAGI